MAILVSARGRCDEPDGCARTLNRARLPHQFRQFTGSFHPNDDTIKVLTMRASTGLEFPKVALVDAGQMPAAGEDERQEARLFYVGSTQRLVSGDGKFFRILFQSQLFINNYILV